MGVIRELLEAQALEEWRLRSKQAERQRQQLAGKPAAELRGAFKDAYRAARENIHFTGSPFKTAGDFAWEPDVPVPKTKMLKLAARLLRAHDPLKSKETVRKSKYNDIARERRATLARAGIQDEQAFIGGGAESILGATMTTALTESIAAFREAQQHVDQLDEGARWEGAKAGWKAAGQGSSWNPLAWARAIGGARQGWKQGAAIETDKAARASKFRQLQTQRAISRAVGGPTYGRRSGMDLSQMRPGQAYRMTQRSRAALGTANVTPEKHKSSWEAHFQQRRAGRAPLPGQEPAAKPAPATSASPAGATPQTKEPNEGLPKRAGGPAGSAGAPAATPASPAKPASSEGPYFEPEEPASASPTPAPAPAPASTPPAAPPAGGPIPPPANPPVAPGTGILNPRSARNVGAVSRPLRPANPPSAPSAPPPRQRRSRAELDLLSKESIDYKNALIEGLLAWKTKNKLPKSVPPLGKPPVRMADIRAKIQTPKTTR